jgi:DUF971 family protein
MDDRYEVIDMVVRRDEGISATFADGHGAMFELTELRIGCPCTTCRDLRDRGESPWPSPGSPTPLGITDAGFHGAWGLNIMWNDGHSTGIYTFETLRRWSESQLAYGPDTGLAGE